MKVAIVYDRVNKWGGAERVLLSLKKIFPQAHLFTSVYDLKKAPWARKFKKIKTSFLQYVPFAKGNHEYYAILMPLAFESFNFKNYDLVISVTSEAAKGIVTNSETKHICYLLTPTRYLWSGYNTYFNNNLIKIISKPAVNYLRFWDKRSAHRVDKLITISEEVRMRAKKYYNLGSDVVYPSYDEKKFFKKTRMKRNDNYLIVSRLVSYKKVDLAVKAFNDIGLPLIIVGEGRQEKYLKSIAKPNIIFKSKLTDESLRQYYETSKALIHPQREDFGIVAVEAQACGLPLIAYGKGGAVETVINGKTGIFFENQTKKDIINAILRFQKMKFKERDIIKNAKRFTEKRFLEEFQKITNV